MRVLATKHHVGRYVPPEPGQRGIMGGAEQLPLFDSPVSGMVLAPHQGANQECNRPDQLRQCRDHCYSDLGFLLPVTTSPPLGLGVKGRKELV